MVDMLIVDGRDKRLAFLGLDGILTATCCPNCVGFLTGPAFNRFSLDGSSEVLPSQMFDGSDSMKCYIPDEEYQAMEANDLVLAENRSRYFMARLGRTLIRLAVLPIGCRIGSTPCARIVASL